MRAQLERRKQNDEGFTLIELLLVIIILGILAAVVVFSVRGVSDRGKASACKASKTALATAAEAFYSKNQDYPATLNLLKPDFISDFGGQPQNAAGAKLKDTDDFVILGGGDAKNSWKITYGYKAGDPLADPPVPAQYTLTTPDC